MALTDRQIAKSKPKDRPYKLADGEGLYLYVTTKGAKLWRMKYRYDGKEKLLSFGKYPAKTLKAARADRDEAKGQLASGNDPAAVKKSHEAEKLRLEEHLFARLVEAYLEKLRKEGRAPVTVMKNRWLLEKATADFGNVPVAEITAPLILKTLKKIEEKGTLETANRLRTVMGTILRYAMALGWIDADPTPGLRGAIANPKTEHRAAITDPSQFGALLRAIESYEGYKSTKIALKLLALLYPRPGELRLACWDEFDLKAKVWSVPAERMKMRRAHRVPLPSAAIEELCELKELTGHHRYILPSLRSFQRPMSENTLNAALRRMGFSKQEMTSHGFRSTFSTMANESGLWHPDAIERALAHIEENAVRRAYDRSEHWEERVKMSEWWAEKVDKLSR